jgi:fumarate hydratase subunit alpha
VPGDKINILAGGKGFGSENMSAIKMLTPSYGVQGVKDFILDTVRNAGPNPCPPMVVGVGIGGTFDKAAQLAKKATLRSINTHNPDARYAAMEDELLASINKMGFGPAGLGGSTTAIGVNIETYPTHIAGMPVAVNICCHAARHKSAVI